MIKNSRLAGLLKQERFLFHSILENLEVGYLLLDANLVPTHVNQRMAECLGVRHRHEIHFHSIPNKLASLVSLVKQGRQKTGLYTHSADLKGVSITYTFTVCMYQPGSSSDSVLILAENNMEHLHALAAAGEEAFRKLMFKVSRQFSHIFNNAITQVSILSDLFPARKDDPAFIAELERSLPRAVARLKRPISQLQLLQEHEMERIQPLPLVLAIEAGWQSAVKAHGDKTPALVTEIADDSLLINVRKHEIEVLFGELFLNAIESLPNAAQIIVVIERNADGTRAVVQIHDAGNGFPPGFTPAACETEKASGLGLGLILVKTAAAKARASVQFLKSSRLHGANVQVAFETLN